GVDPRRGYNHGKKFTATDVCSTNLHAKCSTRGSANGRTTRLSTCGSHFEESIPQNQILGQNIL
ncbi:hypothetical protein T265_09497, partial [Opisthorchis viverrini]